MTKTEIIFRGRKLCISSALKTNPCCRLFLCFLSRHALTCLIVIVTINTAIVLIINHHLWRSRRCCSPPPSTLYKTRAGQSSLEAFGEGRAGDGYHYDGHDQHDYDAISKSVGQPSQFNGDLFVLVQFYMLHGV